ncbi:MAG: PadR family transcriptional regulator [Sphingopyxis terrae]|nr:MAG: PadR family transcriptional regulator [Sphingopyxis terrae]
MSLRMLILAIVEAKPSTGYAITKEFDAVAGFFWRASHQQVYRELAALADEGLVRFKDVAQEGRPDKKVHAITVAGRRAFAEWYAQPQDIPRLNDPLMVKVFTGELGGVDNLIEQLSAARAHMAYYMLVRGGLAEKRVVKIAGYADRLLKSSKDPLAAVNRRIEILLKRGEH